MDSPKSNEAVEQLKLKILEMKQDIARKQRILQKSEKKAAKHRFQEQADICTRNEAITSNLSEKADVSLPESVGVIPGGLNHLPSPQELSRNHDDKVTNSCTKTVETAMTSECMPLACSPENEENVISKSLASTNDAIRRDAVSDEWMRDVPRKESGASVADRRKDDDGAGSTEAGEENEPRSTSEVSCAGGRHDQTAMKETKAARLSRRDSIVPVPQLRRSNRACRKSHLLRSEDFLLERKSAVQQCAISSEGDRRPPKICKGDPPLNADWQQQSVTCLFPEFPMSSSPNADFALPDSDYGMLKLQVLQKRLQPRDVINGDIGSPRDVRSSRVSEHDPCVPCEGKTCSTRSDDGRTWEKCHVATLPDERIRALALGRFRRHDAFVVVVVQTNVVSTYRNAKSDPRQWTLLEECRLDLRRFAKSCVTCLETEDVVATVCVGSDGDQAPALWMHACDADLRVTLRKASVAQTVVGAQAQTMFCSDVGGNTVACARVGSQKSTVTQYGFDASFQELCQENNSFVEVSDALNSVMAIDGLEKALLGLSATVLYIWNRTNGQLVKEIDPNKGKVTHNWNILCVQFATFCALHKGLLFLGVVHTSYKQELRLVVINPSTSRWWTVTSFPSDLIPTVFKQRLTRGRRHILKDAKRHGRFLIMVGGVVSLWNVSTGTLLGYLDDSHVNTAAISQRPGEAGPTILTADNQGNVIMYLTCISNKAV